MGEPGYWQCVPCGQIVDVKETGEVLGHRLPADDRRCRYNRGACAVSRCQLKKKVAISKSQSSLGLTTVRKETESKAVKGRKGKQKKQARRITRGMRVSEASDSGSSMQV